VFCGKREESCLRESVSIFTERKKRKFEKGKKSFLNGQCPEMGVFLGGKGKKLHLKKGKCILECTRPNTMRLWYGMVHTSSIYSRGISKKRGGLVVIMCDHLVVGKLLAVFESCGIFGSWEWLECKKVA